jgi:hypothetical protein
MIPKELKASNKRKSKEMFFIQKNEEYHVFFHYIRKHPSLLSRTKLNTDKMTDSFSIHSANSE